MSNVLDITMDEFLMGRQVRYPLDAQSLYNAPIMVGRANQLLEEFGQYRGVHSGYRPPAINAITPNASKKSKHMICAACDLEDADGKLVAFCKANEALLEKIGLWFEDPAKTPGWCHIQILPYGSWKPGKTRMFHV